MLHPLLQLHLQPLKLKPISLTNNGTTLLSLALVAPPEKEDHYHHPNLIPTPFLPSPISIIPTLKPHFFHLPLPLPLLHPSPHNNSDNNTTSSISLLSLVLFLYPIPLIYNLSLLNSRILNLNCVVRLICVLGMEKHLYKKMLTMMEAHFLIIS